MTDEEWEKYEAIVVRLGLTLVQVMRLRHLLGYLPSPTELAQYAAGYHKARNRYAS